MSKIKKLFKINLSLLLIITTMSGLLFTGCEKDEDEKDNTSKKENSSNEVSQAFDEYMQELFIEEMSIDSVSTHFNLENPEVYGIVFEEASWGESLTIESIESDYAEQKEILDKLDTFDTSKLTKEQKLTFDTLYSYLENSYSVKDYYLLDELFSPMNGIQASIPIIFSEYDFFTEDDIDDYLTLLETIDDYVDSLLEYERARAKKGYFLTDSSADQVIEQCEDFIGARENCLVSIFEDKLDDFGITGDAKEEYMDRLDTAISHDLIPTYENIIETLDDLKGSRSSDLGLCELDGGKEYYEALVRSYTGSDKSIDELIEVVEQSLTDNTNIVYTLLSNDADLYDKYLEFEYPDADPKSTIESQIEKAKKYFPETDEIPFEVKSVPESLESTMNPAFYLVPPIDNPNKNMIYINYGEEYEHMDLYVTLAHEGVPGHMYQCYYFASTNPDPVRNLISIGGYNEGWATYVEYYAYLFAGMSKSMAALASANDHYNFALYSRIDLGIHYESWDVDDVSDFLEIYGIYDDELAQTLFETLIDDPAVYLQYYIGYLEFEELCNKAVKEVDDFDIIEFHKFILETGPTYFEIIDERMDAWIKEQNN